MRKGAADKADAAGSMGAVGPEGAVSAPEVTAEASPEKKKKGEKKTVSQGLRLSRVPYLAEGSEAYSSGTWGTVVSHLAPVNVNHERTFPNFYLVSTRRFCSSDVPTFFFRLSRRSLCSRVGVNMRIVTGAGEGKSG